MKFIWKYLLRGLIFFLPIFLTLYILYIFIVWSESWVANMIRPVAPGLYYPGLGLVLTFIFLILLGIFISRPSFARTLQFVELPFKNVPIIKSVYLAIKSLADYFSPDGDQAAQHVVMVKWPDTEVEIIGFVTRSNFDDLPNGFPKADEKIAVYIPLSYQIGGWTVFIPKEYVTQVDMPVEKAMQMTLTAWMPNKA